MDQNKIYSDKEIRSFVGDVTLPEEGGRTIQGYAIVFNQRSNIMYDFFQNRYFVEEIAPEAVSRELLDSCDVRALVEHNRERLLARANGGKGTLHLEIDSVGLKYRFDAPNTTDGNDLLELVRRGDICGSSFCFRCKDEDVERTWNKDEKVWVHRITRFSGIYDVSPTSSPAYSQTSVSVRSLDPPEVDNSDEGDIPDEEYYEELRSMFTK